MKKERYVHLANMELPHHVFQDPYLGPGQLGYVQRGVVQTRDKGMDGITFHRGLPILPRDSPNAPRKQPRFSVADIAKEMKIAGLWEGASSLHQQFPVHLSHLDVHSSCSVSSPLGC